MAKTPPPIRPVKLSKMDLLTAEIANDWRHQNSVEINSRIRLVRFEAEEIDKKIIGLSGALANARERRAKLEAMLRGLTSVIDKR